MGILSRVRDYLLGLKYFSETKKIFDLLENDDSASWTSIILEPVFYIEHKESGYRLWCASGPLFLSHCDKYGKAIRKINIISKLILWQSVLDTRNNLEIAHGTYDKSNKIRDIKFWNQ